MVNTASIAGKHGQGWLSAYSATKFGVVGLSQSPAQGASSDGVQVTALCPGFVDTAMTDWVEGRCREEMIQPEDIAEAVRFLLRTSRAASCPRSSSSGRAIRPKRSGDVVSRSRCGARARRAPGRPGRARTRPGDGTGRSQAQPERSRSSRARSPLARSAAGRRDGRCEARQVGTLARGAMLASSIARRVFSSRGVAGRDRPRAPV